MMQYLKSVTSIHSGKVIKMHATDKKFYFVPMCNSGKLPLISYRPKNTSLIGIPY